MKHPDQVITSQQLLNDVWHRNSDPGRTVAMHVSSLRKALEDHKPNSLIRTVKGRGYIFESGRMGEVTQHASFRAAPDCADLEVRPQIFGQRALRPRERSLFGLLLLNPGITFTRECIASLIWGLNDVDLRTVDVTVSRIREVFSQRAMRNPIRGVTGRGYQINPYEVEQTMLLLPSFAHPT
jgi:DNA-binding response OmpR family regulator